MTVAAALSPGLAGQRLFFFLLLASSLGLVFLSRNDSPVTDRLRGVINDAATPVLAAVASPLQSAKAFADHTAGLFSLYADNQALRVQNAELLQWQLISNRLEAENRSLRLLLNSTSALTERSVTAQVVSEGIGSASQSALITAGSQAGVQRGQPVLNAQGVVGRITETGERSARVLFLTDMNFNLPIMLQHSGVKAMLSGKGSDLPVLTYLDSAEGLAEGDSIITSGDGGLFPKGLPVGVVESISVDGTVRVRPFAFALPMDYVTVIQQPGVVAPDAR